MESLASTMTSFSVPEHTSEEWAAINAEADAWESRERDRLAAERLARTRIPERFLAAPFKECPPKVRDWAQEVLDGGARSLTLFGRPGRGKTHIACAALLRLHEHVRVLFTSFKDVADEIQATYHGEGTEADILYRYGNVPVLCIDDFGKFRATDWSLPVLFSLIDKRYGQGRPTLYTTNYDSKGLREKLTLNGDSEYAEAILSRMRDGVMLRVDGEDRRSA